MNNLNNPVVPEAVPITAELLAQHSITADEYAHIESALGRVPSLTELGIYSVMWSEHCSYKSSRVHLKRLPTKSELVVQGPGENAGIIDVGEPDLSYEHQEEAFLAQLQLAAERNLPASIHCLRTWGRLHELLRDHPRPACGLVLHSFGGPAEMIPALAKLGAYFSFPGYFLHERKQRQRDAFKRVPPERLLIEAHAPDQLLPPERNRFPLTGADGRPLNHPANLIAVYEGLAEVFSEKVEALAARVEENFQRVFDGIKRGGAAT